MIESQPKDNNDQDGSNDGSDGETYQGYPKLGSRGMAIWKCGLDIEITGGGELGQLLYMYVHICDGHQILNQKPNWYGMGTCIVVAYGYGAKP